MSCTPMTEMSDQAKNQLACNLAALILHDSNTDLTSENLSKVLKNSGMTVPAYWPLLMAKALEGQNFSDLLKCGGGSGSGPVVTGGEAVVEEEEKEPTVEEESEDMDMGDLFG